MVDGSIDSESASGQIRLNRRNFGISASDNSLRPGVSASIYTDLPMLDAQGKLLRSHSKIRRLFNDCLDELRPVAISKRDFLG